MKDLSSLNSPAPALPGDAAMIRKALEILSQSAHGQPLAEMVAREKIEIKIIRTPQETTYLPQTRQAYVGVSPNHPPSPARFVLLLAGVLREAQQELEGKKHPPLTAPLDEHLKVSGDKFADKVYTLCAITHDLNDLENFSDYNFLNELQGMGYGEAWEIYLKTRN